MSPKGSPFIPSGVVVDGVLYLVNDIQSILTAHDVKTGEVLYQGRLGEAKKEGFSASPVALDGKVFFTNDDGETFVLQGGPRVQAAARQQLGEPTLASPALVDGRWYFRTASVARGDRVGQRQIPAPHAGLRHSRRQDDTTTQDFKGW